MVSALNGDSIRISGIHIDLHTGTASHAGISMTTEAWLPWLEIARSHHQTALAARETLLGPRAKQDFEAKMQAVDSEMQAAMVAISAASFALDAFYGRVKDLAPPPHDLATAWHNNRTPRHRQIPELLTLNFTYPPGGRQELQDTTKTLYMLRDWLVHPPAGFKQPQRHPALAEYFEWRKTVFTVENSGQAYEFVAAVIKLSLKNPKPQHKDLYTWATNVQRLTEPFTKP